MTASLALGPCTSGRPQRGLPDKPGMPRTANRPRQVRTTATLQPRSRAMAAFAVSPAAASTIFARSTSRCGLVPARTILVEDAPDLAAVALRVAGQALALGVGGHP